MTVCKMSTEIKYLLQPFITNLFLYSSASSISGCKIRLFVCCCLASMLMCLHNCSWCEMQGKWDFIPLQVQAVESSDGFKRYLYLCRLHYFCIIRIKRTWESAVFGDGSINQINHGIMEWFVLERTLRIIFCIRLLTTPSSLVLNTSQDRESTSSLSNLFQCLTTPTVKKFSLIPILNMPFSVSGHSPLSYHTCPHEKPLSNLLASTL